MSLLCWKTTQAKTKGDLVHSSVNQFDRDAHKEFVIVKNFELSHIKTNNIKVTTKSRSEKRTWHVHASIDNGAKSFPIRSV